MEQIATQDERIARQLLGYVVFGEKCETAQIEYRYQLRDRHNRWSVLARIGQQEFHISESRFFGALAEILDQLHEDCYIVLRHQVLVSHGKGMQIATLEERLHPYVPVTGRDSGSGGTVTYQLKLITDDLSVETSVYSLFPYMVTDLGAAMEQLRRQLPEGTQVRICYFCNHLIEYNDHGGTDYRHDQLYCFRDAPDAREHLMAVYPVLRGHEHLLRHGTSDMDAFHSCPCFSYRSRARP